jgi:DNA-binding transcriptional MocR family regulator
MSAARRTRLVELSREYDFLVAADEVYQLLWYDQAPPAALGTMADRGNILSLGSFSKILAPGLRLGWIQTSPKLMEKLLDSGAVNSGGSFNHFTSHVVRHAIELGLQQSFLEELRQTYRSRVRAMDTALNEHVGDLADWHHPEGGYFFWLKFSQDVDTTELRRRAGEYQTGFQPGENFSSNGGLRNYLRLSFAHYGEADIQQGVARLGRLLRENIQM